MRPNVRASSYNHEHDIPTSTATQPLTPNCQSLKPNGTSLAGNGTQKEEAGGNGKRRHRISQPAYDVDSEDGFQPNGKRVRAVRSRVGAERRNSETREPSVIPQVAISPSTNRTFV